MMKRFGLKFEFHIDIVLLIRPNKNIWVVPVTGPTLNSFNPLRIVNSKNNIHIFLSSEFPLQVSVMAKMQQFITECNKIN